MSLKEKWHKLEETKPGTAEFITFTLLSVGTALIQFILMPVLKAAFNQTSLVASSFQVLRIGTNYDGSPYYLFDYGAGSIDAGGGGGLAYFLAVEIAIGVGQIFNFITQRKFAFKSDSSVWIAAMWYLIAYVLITFGCAAVQGLYKAALYNQLINTMGMGKGGETLADVLTMIINAFISYIVFYPILKIIFKDKKKQ